MRPKGLIVLDGPDACGKTTLAKTLCKLYGGLHLHCEGKRFEDMFNYQTEVLVEATKHCEDQLVVIDRLWPSEHIYAGVFRGGTKFPHQRRLMDRVIRKHAGLYVFCLPYSVGDAVCRHRKNIDEDHPYSDKDYKQLLVDYCCLYGSMEHRPDVFKYHIEVDGRDIDTTCECLVASLTNWRSYQYQPCLSQDPGILGHLQGAKYLVVGEEVKPKTKLYKWPFYEHGNSSAYLCKALDKADIDDTKLMFMNAKDPHFMKHVTRLVRGHDLIPVALGKIARSALLQFGFKIRELPHPQFMRRFHHDISYARMIKEELT